MAKKEDGFEKLARLIKEEGEDIRKEIKKEISEEIGGLRGGSKGSLASLEQTMNEGFSRIDRRLDETVQFQLDEHAHRIKVLEDKPLSR